MMQDRCIVAIEVEQKVIRALSNDDIDCAGDLGDP